ncbi:MAG: hydantoinase B/oxoprolinase family protein [Xanthomonadaceae bacterium]|nr:hydantoinase B/oxoprolinase family protein [Xanthomonadaceae bacterium]
MPPAGRMDPIELSLFASRLAAACDEMGAVLRRSALSPNIRERLDFSCALFSADGFLAAQAAHIPVHLGSMAFAMGDLVRRRDWRPDDALVFNDPFLGGTHLPDVTLVAPVFVDDTLVGFVANRAHHADIGADAPGSMPLSTTLEEEGVLIPPLPYAEVDALLSRLANPARTRGDLAAQASANRAGARRVSALAARMGVAEFADALHALDAYGARAAGSALAALPAGRFTFTDLLDDDGAGTLDLPVAVEITIAAGRITVDFAGTAPQCRGNLNCPLPVTAAAIWYAFRCLMPDGVPACHGAFASIEIRAPEGSLVNARRPAAVAAGNVETSQRIVDAVLGALAQAAPERICAAAQGTMNNVALGSRGSAPWDYYETLGGGLGAHAHGPGLSAVQAHMTNTLNTPAEVLELELPLRIREHAVRRGSGGAGLHGGGDGLVREIEFLAPATVTLLTERRRRGPWGLAGGSDGAPGVNQLNGDLLPGKCCIAADGGDRLRVETPGGGGWGRVL